MNLVTTHTLLFQNRTMNVVIEGYKKKSKIQWVMNTCQFRPAVYVAQPCIILARSLLCSAASPALSLLANSFQPFFFIIIIIYYYFFIQIVPNNSINCLYKEFILYFSGTGLIHLMLLVMTIPRPNYKEIRYIPFVSIIEPIIESLYLYIKSSTR